MAEETSGNSEKLPPELKVVCVAVPPDLKFVPVDAMTLEQAKFAVKKLAAEIAEIRAEQERRSKDYAFRQWQASRLPG